MEPNWEEGYTPYRFGAVSWAYQKVDKAKWIILDSVKEHLIPHIAGKTTKEMYDALVTLYRVWTSLTRCFWETSLPRSNTCMSDIDIVASYLMKITELRDQSAAIGEKIKSWDLVPIALNGHSSSWEFVWGVSAHGMLLNFENLLEDFIWEETKLEIVSSKVEEIQNLSLIKKMRRGGKKGELGRG